MKRKVLVLICCIIMGMVLQWPLLLKTYAERNMQDLPVSDLVEFAVRWENADAGAVYSFKSFREPDTGSPDGYGEAAVVTQGSLEGICGSYTVFIEISDRTGALSFGENYCIQLDMPEGTVFDTGTCGGVIDFTNGGEKITVGSWELSGKGVLSIFMCDDDDFHREIGEWMGMITLSVFVEGESAGETLPSIDKKNGIFDACRQCVIWEMDVVIPADSGDHNSWYIEDSRTAFSHSDISGEIIDMQMMLESGGECIEILPVEAAGGDDRIAYYLTESGNNTGERIYFMNRCECTLGDCRYWGDRCGGESCVYRSGDSMMTSDNMTYTDNDGNIWCSCWRYKSDASIKLTYSVSVSELLQYLEDDKSDLGQRICNYATLNSDGSRIREDWAEVLLQKLFVKTQTVRPSVSNEYVGTYSVTFNPYGYDYSAADCVTLTDVMSNLAYVEGSIEVRIGDRYLTQESDDFISKLPREDYTDRYFSFSESDNADTFTLRIWYPTFSPFTITYKAYVADVEAGKGGDYSNTISMDQISTTLKGLAYTFDAEWFGYTKSLTVEKVDENESNTGLSGAEFDIYRYIPDGEPVYQSTVVTDEDGTAVFHTLRPLIVNTDTLYYLEEVKAPLGYELNGERYWFCFLENGIDESSLYEAVGEDASYCAWLDEGGRADIHITVADKKLEKPDVSGGDEVISHAERPSTDNNSSVTVSSPILLQSPEGESVTSPQTGENASLPVCIVLLCVLTPIVYRLKKQT